MKIIDKEEREAHKLHIISEGMKGMLYGGIVSLGLYTYLKKCRTALFARLNTSIKTCIIVMPTISLSAFWADAGSVQFDTAGIYTVTFTRCALLVTPLLAIAY